MHIQKVIIKNFRCFEHLEVNLDPDINIFVGNNGSGKSALLDGIAAAMYPYVRLIQEKVNKEYNYKEESPVLQRDLPAKQEGSKRKNQADFNLLATGFPHWTIIYEKPPTDNDNERITVDFGYPPSYIKDEFKKLYFAIENQCDTINNEPKSELSIIAYYKSNRHLTNIGDLENIPNKSFDRFDALNNAFDATGKFTDLANWFFVRE
jgi:predicted ATP-binding protein involved in virulence